LCWSWRERGVELALPAALRSTSVDDLDLTRPETAQLAAILVEEGAQIDVQSKLVALAAENRQLAEKAYEAFVCAGHDVHLPAALRDNKMVKDGTRCPWCEAWTWVRPGHERRCPRAASGTAPPPPPVTELADDWSVGTAETASSTPAAGTAVLGEPEPEGRQAEPNAEADGSAAPES
jgi:pyruvate/2-oxoglutarate dehydrogenase complex dihydrolipoamide acyltransferase (E2) component